MQYRISKISLPTCFFNLTAPIFPYSKLRRKILSLVVRLLDPFGGVFFRGKKCSINEKEYIQYYKVIFVCCFWRTNLSVHVPYWYNIPQVYAVFVHQELVMMHLSQVLVVTYPLQIWLQTSIIYPSQKGTFAALVNAVL